MSNNTLTTQDEVAEENLPVPSEPTFIAEFETMDLTPLRNESFLVAVSTGARDKGKFLSTTVRGPYTFFEMCEEVGVMYKEHQHHPKVYICEKNRDKRPRWLDENTVDYVECHYIDIITEGMLEGAFDEGKEYTCTPGIVTADDEEILQDPAHRK